MLCTAYFKLKILCIETGFDQLYFVYLNQFSCNLQNNFIYNCRKCRNIYLLSDTHMIIKLIHVYADQNAVNSCERVKLGVGRVNGSRGRGRS